jgi:Tfp pilus assembly ATPase PilU
MQTFDQDLAAKVHAGVVEEQTALSYASNRQDFKLMLQGSLVARAGAANIEAFAEQDEEAPPSV